MQNQGGLGPGGYPGQQPSGMLPQGASMGGQQMFPQQQMYQGAGIQGGMQRSGMQMGYQGQSMPIQQGAGSMMSGGIGYQGPASGPGGPIPARNYPSQGYGGPPQPNMGQFPQMVPGSMGMTSSASFAPSSAAPGMTSSASFAPSSAAPGSGYMNTQAGMPGPQMGQNVSHATPGQYPPQSSSMHMNQPSSHSIPSQMGGAPPSGASITQQGPSSQSSNLHSAQPSTVPSSQQPVKEPEPRAKSLQPPVYSAEILDNLKIFSVPQLCTIARELVHDLSVRTSILAQTMKLFSEKKNASVSASDPEQILEYCQLLLNKLVEIRLRIERQMPKKKFNTNAFIARMSMPGEQEVTEKFKREKETFLENRNRLIKISSDLKMLDWMASVSDPHYLKRVDKLKGSCSSSHAY